MTTDHNPHNPDAENDDLDVDLSQLNSRKTNSRKIVSMVAGGMIILVMLIAVPLFIKFVLLKEDAPAAQTTKDEALQGKQTDNDSIATMQKRMEAERAEQAALLQRQLEAQQRQKEELERRKAEAERKQREMEEALRRQQGAGQQSGNNAQSGDRPMTPAERKLTGSVMVDFGENGKEAAGSDSSSNGSLNAMLKTEDFAPSVAGMQTIDSRYLLIRGSQIPCVLKTKVVTDYQGMVLCEITKDVYSEDVSTLLIRRGSTAVGQITKAITQGASRVFINWSGIDTPEHIRIPVDALGADTLGAAGAPAWMDTHFWQRFGNTLKLMTFSDLLETGKNVASQGSGTNNGYISYENTTDGVENMANTTLQKEINIPDTAYINQGTLMNIFVPRDLDFTSVYHNQ